MLFINMKVADLQNIRVTVIEIHVQVLKGELLKYVNKVDYMIKRHNDVSAVLPVHPVNSPSCSQQFLNNQESLI